MNYKTKTTEIKSDKGCWSKTLVEIFKEEEKIGEYVRGYPRHGAATFAPFHLFGRDWALYSQDYQTIELMTLPDCRPVELTEESKKDIYSYCPIEILVPRYYLWEWGDNNENKDIIDLEEAEEPPQNKGKEIHGPPQYHNFALTQGCCWGDDSDMKVNILDLSGIQEGKLEYLKVDGYQLYLPIHNSCSLKDIEIWSELAPSGEIHADFKIPSIKFVRKKGKTLTKENFYE